jgi:SAM-dependent methyltransferase
MSTCRVCGNSVGNRTFRAREMQCGFRDEFDYNECARCECLQIATIPENLSKYYPKDYYSFRSIGPTVSYTRTGLAGVKERFIVKQLTRHFFQRKSAVGAWLARRSSVAGDYPTWVREKTVDLGLVEASPILDVGCGTGHFLLELRNQGLTNLTGVDPFIDADIRHPGGVAVFKKSLSDMTGEFDLIMLHHSFEHMGDPQGVLKDLHRLLRKNRYAVIRIPVAASLAWKKYGVNWFALDAPRHLFLHTRKSMQLLAEQAGFDMPEMLFDASGISWWASEQYVHDIPLMDPRSYWVSRPQSLMFSREQVASLAAYDAELNRTGEADCACFFLCKK